MKITVIGAGNGGQSIAGYAAIQGHQVCLYNHILDDLGCLPDTKEIYLQGAIQGVGKLDVVTDDIKLATEYADLIMVVVTANAHSSIAKSMAPYLHDDQVVLLNPGRTGGAFVFMQTLKECGNISNAHIGEAQTLVYACRLIENGKVNIIGVKQRVLLSGKNKKETDFIINFIKPLYQCFYPADNLLQTSLENIGCIFHPCIVLFNAAAIERGESFYFYRDMTDGVANFINQLDTERLAVAKAYGINLISARDWIVYAYPETKGNTLRERMINNPGYNEIKNPSTIYSRQLNEDIPTGIVPMAALGELACVDVSLMKAVIKMGGVLLNKDFDKIGRNLKNLGLEGMSMDDILRSFKNE